MYLALEQLGLDWAFSMHSIGLFLEREIKCGLNFYFRLHSNVEILGMVKVPGTDERERI